MRQFKTCDHISLKHESLRLDSRTFKPISYVRMKSSIYFNKFHTPPESTSHSDSITFPPQRATRQQVMRQDPSILELTIFLDTLTRYKRICPIRLNISHYPYLPEALRLSLTERPSSRILILPRKPQALKPPTLGLFFLLMSMLYKRHAGIRDPDEGGGPLFSSLSG